jgi:hypothetical protein
LYRLERGRAKKKGSSEAIFRISQRRPVRRLANTRDSKLESVFDQDSPISGRAARLP